MRGRRSGNTSRAPFWPTEPKRAILAKPAQPGIWPNEPKLQKGNIGAERAAAVFNLELNQLSVEVRMAVLADEEVAGCARRGAAAPSNLLGHGFCHDSAKAFRNIVSLPSGET
jgi:hypothetical protein